jgi:hypothetical protein
METFDSTEIYDNGFTDGGRYVLNFLVNEEEIKIPTHLSIWKDFFETIPGTRMVVSVIKDERERILKEINFIEEQSHATRTPLYQETLFTKIREIVGH